MPVDAKMPVLLPGAYYTGTVEATGTNAVEGAVKSHLTRVT